MPLGDSITVGGHIDGTPPLNERTGYRQKLWQLLQAAGYNVDFVGSQVAGEAVPNFDPDNEGHGGWRDDQIAANVYAWLQANPAPHHRVPGAHHRPGAQQPDDYALQQQRGGHG